MIESEFFDGCFRALTGYPKPMRWQRRLYELFLQGNVPSSCDLPTGLGKTSIIVLWLIALAAKPSKMPRRLIYIVNRRTVVDQATQEAKKIRQRLSNSPPLLERLQSLCSFEVDMPLAISSLRGQFADNGEWRDDPAKPAIVVGTVDMIGSRLLFGGYRCGFRSRPTHAGLLGQDSLIVHDEAHLEPAFQCLLNNIVKIQALDLRPTKCIALTATSRDSANGFSLIPSDFADALVSKRVTASKGITFFDAESEQDVPKVIVERALSYSDTGKAILIYVRRVTDVQKTITALYREKLNAEQLSGTLRGWERDHLVSSNSVLARFLPPNDRPAGVDPESGTVYLTCTSAGEVGINLSGDHLICDLTTYCGMSQRLGRANRFGDDDANIDIVIPPTVE